MIGASEQFLYHMFKFPDRKLLEPKSQQDTNHICTLIGMADNEFRRANNCGEKR